MWSLANAAERVGSEALKATFRKYDRSGNGHLDQREWVAAAEEMGYGGVAHRMFEQLDENRSGQISYDELVKSLYKSPPADSTAKSMLTTMMWTQQGVIDKQQDGADAVTSSWVLRGSTAQQVKTGVLMAGMAQQQQSTPTALALPGRVRRAPPAAACAELRRLLGTSGLHVAEILAIFDQDAHGALLVDDVEFLKVMREKLGYKGSYFVIKQVFKELDRDGEPTPQRSTHAHPHLYICSRQQCFACCAASP